MMIKEGAGDADKENDDDDSRGGHAYQGLGDSSKAEGSAGQGEIQCRGQCKAMQDRGLY